MNEWKNTPEDIEDYLGFVYKITRIRTGEYYIGQKKFWTKKKKETNWRTYNTSSGKLKDEDLNNSRKYRKEILNCYKSKSRMNFEEFKLIWDAKAIRSDPKCYNRMLNIRLNIDKLKEE